MQRCDVNLLHVEIDAAIDDDLRTILSIDQIVLTSAR